MGLLSWRETLASALRAMTGLVVEVEVEVVVEAAGVGVARALPARRAGKRRRWVGFMVAGCGEVVGVGVGFGEGGGLDWIGLEGEGGGGGGSYILVLGMVLARR